MQGSTSVSGHHQQQLMAAAPPCSLRPVAAAQQRLVAVVAAVFAVLQDPVLAAEAYQSHTLEVYLST